MTYGAHVWTTHVTIRGIGFEPIGADNAIMTG